MKIHQGNKQLILVEYELEIKVMPEKIMFSMIFSDFCLNDTLTIVHTTYKFVYVPCIYLQGVLNYTVVWSLRSTHR